MYGMVSLGGDLHASLDMHFCSHKLHSPSQQKPKASSGRAREPNRAHFILLREKKIQAKKPPLGEFPKQISSLGSPHKSRKPPEGFPSACLNENPQQHCSQGKGHWTQGATLTLRAGGAETAGSIRVQRRLMCSEQGGLWL